MVHGKPGTYTSGCHCDECKEAWRVYVADRRNGGVPVWIEKWARSAGSI